MIFTVRNVILISWRKQDQKSEIRQYTCLRIGQDRIMSVRGFFAMRLLQHMARSSFAKGSLCLCSYECLRLRLVTSPLVGGHGVSPLRVLVGHFDILLLLLIAHLIPSFGTSLGQLREDNVLIRMFPLEILNGLLNEIGIG